MDNTSVKFLYHQDLESRLLWDLNDRNKEYVEIQLFAEKFEDLNCNGILKKINQNYYKCHICNINVPTIFRKQHISSLKHKVFKSVIDNCLDRLKQHIETSTLENDSAKPTNIIFCDNCVTVFKESDYHCHLLSEMHINNALIDDNLAAFEKIFTNSVFYSNEFNNNPTMINIESKIIENILNTDTIVNQSKNESKNDSEKGRKEKQCKNISRTKEMKHASVNQWAAFACDESSDNSSFISNEDSEKHYDSLNEVDADRHSEIRMHDGSLVEVSAENFNGFQISNGNVQCLVCHEPVENENKHILNAKHCTRTRLEIDGNGIRQVDEKWCHCIICNINVSNADIHIGSGTHIANAKAAKITTKAAKTTTKAKKQRNIKYCDLCDINIKGTLSNHLQSEKHLRNEKATEINVNNELLFDNYSLTENGSRLRFNNCSECIPNDPNEASNHLNTESHILACNESLIKNKIKKTNSGTYFCEFCSLEILKGFEFIHIKNQLHVDKVKNIDFTLVSALGNLNKKKPYPLRQLFELSLTDQMQCKICKVDVPNSETYIIQHVSSENHIKKHKKMLDMNKIQKTKKSYFCSVCKTYFSHKRDLDHINSKLHIQAMNSLQISDFAYHYKLNSVTHQMDCQVCIAKVPNSETNLIEHALSNKHKTKYDDILHTNKLVRTEKNNVFKCQICDIFVEFSKELDHIKSGIHKTMKSILKSSSFAFVSNENKTDNNLIYLYKLSSVPSQIECQVCDVKFLNSNTVKHASSLEHTTKYQNLLSINQLEMKGDAFLCRACKIDIANKMELEHINSELHKNNLQSLNNLQVIRDEPQRRLVIRESVNKQEHSENSIVSENKNDSVVVSKDSEINNFNLEYMFEETKNVKQVDCKVCRKPVGKLISCMQMHVDGKKHAENYTTMLKDNLITTTDAEILCRACNESIEKFGEFIHFEKPEHIQKVTEFKVNEANVNIPIIKGSIGGDHNDTEPHRKKRKICINPDNPTDLMESLVDNAQVCKIDIDNKESTINYELYKNSIQSNNNNENDQACEMQGQVDMNENIDKEQKTNNFNASLVSVEFYCNLCNIKIPNIFESKNAHNETMEHKMNSEKYGNNDTTKFDSVINKDSESMDLKLAYMFEESEIVKQVVCKVCRKTVGKSTSIMQMHVDGKTHLKNYYAKLKDNFACTTNSEIICCACNESIEMFGELTHFENPEHIHKVIELKNKVAAEAKYDYEACNIDIPNDKDAVSENDENELHKNQQEIQLTPLLPADSTASIEIPTDVIDSIYQMNVSDNPDVTCLVCQNTMVQNEISAHLNGQVHRNKLRETISYNKMIFEGADFYCTVCNASVVRNDVITHISNFSHKKNLFLYDTNINTDDVD